MAITSRDRISLSVSPRRLVGDAPGLLAMCAQMRGRERMLASFASILRALRGRGMVRAFRRGATSPPSIKGLRLAVNADDVGPAFGPGIIAR